MCIVMEEEFKGLDTGTQFKRGVLNIFEVPVGSFFWGGGEGRRSLCTGCRVDGVQ